jgi:glycosyltransferase involved in cell wall biosynthesis
VSDISLIVSSYNQPNALALVFEGVLTQTVVPDEVVIGDDGSQPDTKELVDAFAVRAPFPVKFTTQEDKGFRKSRALNNAIRIATGRHLLLLDGDCVPPPNWTRCHVEALERGVDFTTAGYVLMSLPRTRALAPEQIASLDLDAQCTPAERREFKKIHHKEILYRLLGQRKKPKILGGNWAATRGCLVAVNGFDEKFAGFGKEDSDIRNRLRNAGFRGRSLWDRNWVFHCSHDLDPRRNLPEVVRAEPDYAYYDSRRDATTCEFGIVQPEAATG